MATRRTIKPVAPPQFAASVVPEYVQQAPLLRKRKITKRKLPSFTEAMMLLHAPEVLRKYWEAILKGLEQGDKAALDAAGEIFSYVRGKGINLNLTQQLLQQNQAAGVDAPVMGCDAFIRQLAEARAGHALPPPSEVIDVTSSPVAECPPADMGA